ncbi:interleukin-13 receptor subunit alpha-2 isoform X1 [Paramormyrops kingsleyae]|uniref:interleukin-13 receptor subunit alpha-2 isoform X1 n=1 Tax=Paramormyrops kingsleyae TaxID=1676925 RepID=UPI003B97969C
MTGTVCYKALWELMALLALAEFSSCEFLVKTAYSPTDLRIMDPGRLGQLHINWTVPPILRSVTDCFVRFQLEYNNTYENRSQIVRIRERSYSAQFDLEKDNHVKVQILISGSCVNSSTEVQSPPVEAVLNAQRKGIPGSKINDSNCVFYNWEYMECIWNKGRVQHPDYQYRLYYWHKGMEQAEECPQYIASKGKKIGCRFNRQFLMDFTEFNICINGSAEGHPLQPAYFTKQIQNLVKPSAITTLSLESLSNGQLSLKWSPSVGRVPHQCLEFEVESGPAGDGDLMQKNITRESSILISRLHEHMPFCLRVRCRVNHFCADSHFWSEWSSSLCLPAEPGLPHILESDDTASGFSDGLESDGESQT